MHSAAEAVDYAGYSQLCRQGPVITELSNVQSDVSANYTRLGMREKLLTL